MAQLPQFFLTEPTPRSGGRAGNGRATPLARVAAPPDTSLAPIGQGLSQLANVIADIDQRFQAVRSVVESEDAETALRVEVQDAFNAQLAQPFPDAPGFRDTLLASRERLAAGLSSQAQARFLQSSNDLIFRASAGLAQEGLKKTRDAGQASFARAAGQFLEEFASASPDEQPESRSRFVAKMGDFVSTGIVRLDQVEAVVEEAEIQQMRVAIRSDPEGMLKRFQEGSIPGLTAEEQVALIDEAETELDQQIRRRALSDTATESARQKASAIFRTKQVIAMTEDDPSVAVIDELMQESIDTFDDGRGILGSDDTEFLLAFGQNLIDTNGNITRDTTDPAAIQEFYRLLLTDEDPQAALDFATSRTGDGLAVNSIGGLVSKAVTARDANHFRNLPEVQDALRFTGDQLASTGDPMLDAMVSFQVRGIQADAQNEFLVRIAAIAGPDGLNKEEVLAVTPAIRDAVVRTHRSRLKALVESGDPARRGVPQTLSVRDACTQWRFMRQQQVSQYEADAFLGRELARHIARDTPADQPFNAVAVVTELAACMRGQPK